MKAPLAPAYRIEPLDGLHDRGTFCSGVVELDDYLHYQAGQDARRKVAAPFVLVDRQRCILGYYTLSAYAIRLNDLPTAIGKRLPRYPLIPATLLGRLAVSSTCRGRRLGKLLLMDALHRSWRNTIEIASVGVVVEALDDKARSFYLHYEFLPLLDLSNKLFLPMTRIQRAFQ